MDKHLVLAKFFVTFEKVRREKDNSHNDENGTADLKRKYKLSPSGCTMLCTLLTHGNLNQRNIAKMMNISSQAVSEAIKKLEQNELIIKESGTHNNEKIISLTKSGAEFAKKLDEGIKIHASTVFKNFNDEETDMLYALLEKFEV